MKTLAATTLSALILMSGQALAWEGITQKCYQKHYVGPKFETTQVLVKPAKKAYEYRGNHRVELVYYPALYREVRHQVAPARWVMREVSCCSQPRC